MIDVFANMNAPQRVAIAHLDGPLLVVAGAGSGKTRVITHRIAHLIQQGVHPTGILAITFTNKAAGEMQERVERMLHLSTPWIATFHAAALRLLKQEAAALPFAYPFTVLDPDDQKQYAKQALAAAGRSPDDLDPGEVLAQIGRWKNQLLLPEEVADDDFAAADILPVYRAYQDLLLRDCRVDFDDLLLRCVRLLEVNPALAARYRERFRYVLIDEYQDTNHAQYRMVKVLGSHGNVCATGDPDQAIYGWRGADIQNILSFERDFPGCRTVYLEENYRSSGHILAAAQGVIERNIHRKPKTIFTRRPVGRRLRLLTVDDQDDEAMAVAAACASLHADGVPYRDIAIFYRINAQSRALEHWLARRQLPYRIIGGTRFYDHAEIRDLIAYLHLLVNPRDSVSFARIVNRPRRGIGERTLDLLRDRAAVEGIGPVELITDPDRLARTELGRAARPVQQFAELWRQLRALPREDAGACVEQVLGLSRLAEFYQAGADADPRAQDRVDNLGELVTAAQQFQGDHPTGGLAGFLDHISLLTAVDNRLRQEEDALVLMTLHAAKGLEFPVVFIVGCEQGLLPLIRDPRTADYEEERRLMYVGLTRAQRQVYLSRAVTRCQFNQVRRNPPSQFLAEIPADCIETRDHHDPRPSPPSVAPSMTTSDLRRAGLLFSGSALRPAAGNALDGPEPGDPFTAGDRVVHRIFGAGAVRQLKGTGERRQIVVAFDGAGERTLSLMHVIDKMRRLGS
jgi:DNA helicase-2/ATP-dependent DNA helicase PcrA